MNVVGQVLVAASGLVLGRWAPTLAMVAILIAVPLRVELFPDVQIATLLLLGAVVGRATTVLEVLRSERVLLVATLCLPLWIVASRLWATQPQFVTALAAKWLTVVLACWFAAADRTSDPRHLVGGFVVALVPHAVWGAAERLRLVEPLGEQLALAARAIDHRGTLRGRALYWHPNRLAEFLEQGGVFLAASGLAGVLPALCAAALVVVAVGVWGTGSMGAAGGLAAGVLLVVGWWLTSVVAPQRSYARFFWLGVALAGALGAGALAYTAHGGLGSRGQVFRFAFGVIEEHPWLGVGGGNWSLAVGGAGLHLSRFWFKGHAHSLPLHLWAELGVVGVAAAVGFFGAPVVSAARRFKDVPRAWQGLGVGAIGGLAALLAHDLFHYFLRDPVDGILPGLLLGLAIAVARRAEPSAP